MRLRDVLPYLLLAALACERSAPTPDRPTRSASPADEAPPAKAAEPEQARAPQPALAQDPPLPTAGPLHYHEVMLGGAGPDEAVPMVVAIHGLGDEPRNFAGLFSTFPEKARLILPQGVDSTEGGGWSWFPIRARDPDVESLAEGIDASADKLAQSIRILTEQKPTHGKPVVTGFSQGGMLTMTLAVHHPEVVGAAVAVGGWLPPPLWPETIEDPKAYPSTVALHGTADNAVFYEPSKEAVEHLTKLGLAVELKSYEGVRHVITPQMQRDLHDALADAVRVQHKAPVSDEQDEP